MRFPIRSSDSAFNVMIQETLMSPIATLGAAETREGWVEHAAVSFADGWSARDVSTPPCFDQATLDFLASATRQARLAAVREERTRLASELHDTLLQAFTGVTLQLQALRGRMLTSPREAEEAMGRVLEVVDVALRDARSAVWDLRAPELVERDVAAALEQSAREAVALHKAARGAPVDLEVTITGERRRLSPDVEIVAQRIGREAVRNALRHADARHISVVIAFKAHHLCLEVCDDGVGFDAAHVNPSEGRGHWGLVGMGERARKAGGTLDVRSAPRAGTVVALRVPVESWSRTPR
jgi:signal transduction histidine kinase